MKKKVTMTNNNKTRGLTTYDKLLVNYIYNSCKGKKGKK
jgi:hypothetical protein